MSQGFEQTDHIKILIHLNIWKYTLYILNIEIFFIFTRVEKWNRAKIKSNENKLTKLYSFSHLPKTSTEDSPPVLITCQ